MAGNNDKLREEWTEESTHRVESLILRNAFACRTPDATETAMAYTRFLRLARMTNDNYPLFLSLLEIDNHYVIDSLIGDEDPFVFFTPIQPTKHLLRECFRLLTFWHPGGIYPKTISIVLESFRQHTITQKTETPSIRYRSTILTTLENT